MRRTLTAASCALAAGALQAGAALAQPAGPPTLAPGAGALIIDPQRQERQLPTPPPGAAAPTPAPAAQTNGQSAPDVLLRNLRIDGPALPAGRLDELTQPFVGKPMDQAAIKGLADAVSAAYARSGLALYTVAVPRQSLAGGMLTLKVVAGFIDAVTVTGPSPKAQNRLVKAYAAHLTRERPLTRRTLERYLSLIRDIPGLKVAVQLYNTTVPGAVRMTLALKQTRLKPTLNFNTRGTANLGAAQAQVGLIGDSLLRQGDTASFSVAAPTHIKRYQYVSAAYAAPIGSDGLTLGANFSYLRTRPKTPPIDGDATSLGLQANYPLVRSYNENLYLSLGLDGLNSDNAIFGQTITADHTRAVRASVSYTKVAPTRVISASLTGSKGVKILGARADARLTDGDFSKATAQAAFSQAIGKAVAVRLRGLAQASDGRLPAAEQLPLGGDYVGRAFYSATVIGDYGYGGSGELAYIDPAPWPAALKGSEIYGFVDAGETWTRARLPYVAAQHYDLASAGAGFRLLVRQKLMVGIEGAKSIDNPYANTSRPWRVIFSWRAQLGN